MAVEPLMVGTMMPNGSAPPWSTGLWPLASC